MVIFIYLRNAQRRSLKNAQISALRRNPGGKKDLKKRSKKEKKKSSKNAQRNAQRFKKTLKETLKEVIWRLKI